MTSRASFPDLGMTKIMKIRCSEAVFTGEQMDITLANKEKQTRTEAGKSGPCILMLVRHTGLGLIE